MVIANNDDFIMLVRICMSAIHFVNLELQNTI